MTAMTRLAVGYDWHLVPPAAAAGGAHCDAPLITRSERREPCATGLKQLQQSRARLVEAGDHERRRIAQNPHHGLQMKLELLAVEAQRLAGRCDASPELALAATALRSHIDSAAGELRELVHAVMPAPLIESGLGAAINDLRDRLPLPTTLSLGLNDSLPERVSSAAYFVVAEALSNAVKHAQATAAGTVGVAYQTTLQATGGTGTFSWTLVQGSLPNGVTLSSSGVISGTPTDAGTFAFTVQVGDPATAGLTITITPASASTSGSSGTSGAPGSSGSSGAPGSSGTSGASGSSGSSGASGSSATGGAPSRPGLPDTGWPTSEGSHWLVIGVLGGFGLLFLVALMVVRRRRHRRTELRQ